MSATVRRYSASVAWRPTGSIATDRLRSIFSRLVYPLRIIGRKHQVWPKHAPTTAEWWTYAGSGRICKSLLAGAITRATPPSAGKPAIAIRVCLERGAPLSSARLLPHHRAGSHRGRSNVHVFRHACGYKLANDGHDARAIQAYLGHRNIQNTTRYTALASGRFKNFWRD